MKSIHAYLTFNGNCRQAMKFYQNCLGGKLNFQTIGNSPLSEQMPIKMKNSILHAELKNDGMIIYGTDLVPEKGLLKGNSLSLFLNCNSKKEAMKYYKKLSHGGNQTQAPKKTHWNTLLGSLTDKYGNEWLILHK